MSPVQLYVYECPPDQTWAIAAVVEDYDLTDNISGIYNEPYDGSLLSPAGPWHWGYLEPGEQYLNAAARIGTVYDLVAFLNVNAPGATWEAWDDPANEFLGDRTMHTPLLGTYSTTCDADGQLCHSAKRVEEWVSRAIASSDPAEHAAIEQEMGLPWERAMRCAIGQHIIPVGPHPDDIAAEEELRVTLPPEITSGQFRICIDADCPSCGWAERWARLDTSPPTFGCPKCDYTSRERNA